MIQVDAIPESGLDRLEDRWSGVQKIRHEFAAEIDQMAAGLPQRPRKKLRSLGQWFRGPARFEDALNRPDVFAICFPLLKADSAGQDAVADIGDADLPQAVRAGFQTLAGHGAGRRRWFAVMLYPMLLLICVAVLGIGFSFWLARDFESMFTEFGIQLPAATRLTLSVAKLVRDGWMVGAFGLAAVALLCLVMNRRGRDRRPFGLTWTDQQLMNNRNVVASWAWHVSLLLESGLSQNDAINIAGGASGVAWLRRSSTTWTRRDQSVHSPGSPVRDRVILFLPKYELLNSVIEQPRSNGQMALLREVAAHYWDRDRSASDWWIEFLVAWFIWIVGAAIVLMVMSLFMPLLAVITGLTGF